MVADNNLFKLPIKTYIFIKKAASVKCAIKNTFFVDGNRQKEL